MDRRLTAYQLLATSFAPAPTLAATGAVAAGVAPPLSTGPLLTAPAPSPLLPRPLAAPRGARGVKGPANPPGEDISPLPPRGPAPRAPRFDRPPRAPPRPPRTLACPFSTLSPPATSDEAEAVSPVAAGASLVVDAEVVAAEVVAAEEEGGGGEGAPASPAENGEFARGFEFVRGCRGLREGGRLPFTLAVGESAAVAGVADESPGVEEGMGTTSEAVDEARGVCRRALPLPSLSSPAPLLPFACGDAPFWPAFQVLRARGC